MISMLTADVAMKVEISMMSARTLKKWPRQGLTYFRGAISVGHPGRRIQRRCPKLLRSRSYVFSVKIQDGRHAKSSQVAEILTFV